eukprot:364580-Chlamydomonas_euryale.AAC.6
MACADGSCRCRRCVCAARRGEHRIRAPSEDHEGGGAHAVAQGGADSATGRTPGVVPQGPGEDGAWGVGGMVGEGLAAGRVRSFPRLHPRCAFLFLPSSVPPRCAFLFLPSSVPPAVLSSSSPHLFLPLCFPLLSNCHTFTQVVHGCGAS